MEEEFFIEKIKELHKLQKTKLKLVTNEIYYVISNNIVNDNKIEHLFDDILDLYYWFGSKIDPLFDELYNYYKNINNEITKDYKGFFLELKEEDTNEKV